VFFIFIVAYVAHLISDQRCFPDFEISNVLVVVPIYPVVGSFRVDQPGEVILWRVIDKGWDVVRDDDLLYTR